MFINSCISIHAPREGSDTMASLIFVCLHGFQSTPPARGATDGSQNRCLLKRFQSTPPARGATSADTVIPRRRTNFNPRPPRGERLFEDVAAAALALFQSTPPARGATNRLHQKMFQSSISIHAPREGSDRKIMQNTYYLHILH